MSAELRPMLVSDLDVVMKIERDAYPLPWTQKVFEECIAGRDECWLFIYEGQQVGHGVISHIVDETHLLNICIAPSFSRRGLGRAFLRLLIDLAAQRKSTVFYLEVRVSNQAAISLYHSEGFNEVGTRPNYYPALSGREDALLMTLDLSFDHYI